MEGDDDHAAMGGDLSECVCVCVGGKMCGGWGFGGRGRERGKARQGKAWQVFHTTKNACLDKVRAGMMPSLSPSHAHAGGVKPSQTPA